jgi:hypothetical protein
VIPPKQNAEFVANMEDVLDVYERPYNEHFPVVCMDEQPVQMIAETRRPLNCEPGKPLRYDVEYQRNGTVNNIMFVEPLRGWRKVNIRPRKTQLDWAQEIKELLDVDYAEVQKVILVCDNLNTHKISSLYEAFSPQEARRLRNRLEIHYTPKHGSWLNIAEIELSILTRQCLNRRMGDLAQYCNEVKSWYNQRNAIQKVVDWQFTTENARIKLKKLYPQF